MIAIDDIRKLSREAFQKNMKVTAITYAEEATRLKDATADDFLHLATVLFNNNEYRRCLALLEQKRTLSAENLSVLSQLIRPSSSQRPKYQPPSKVNITLTTSTTALSLTNKQLIYIISIALQCLYQLNQYEDGLLLIEDLLYTDMNNPIYSHMIQTCLQLYFTCTDDISDMKTSPDGSNTNTCTQIYELNVISALYCTAARCYDQLDSHELAKKCYMTAVLIDPCLLEALEELKTNSFLSLQDRIDFYHTIDFTSKEWLKSHYQSMLLYDVALYDPTYNDNNNIDMNIFPPSPTTTIANTTINLSSSHTHTHTQSKGTFDITPFASYIPSLSALTRGLTHEIGSSSTSIKVRTAEYLLEYTCHINDAYRLARQAYIEDPFYHSGLLVYIACLVELSSTAELFYLGHELTHIFPKKAVSWYTVGCYYTCCKKYDMAQKYFIKCTKLDKRFAKGYIMLAHVFSAQEEREHAISALRTSCQLLPGDHRCVVLMAQELMKTNSVSLALHLLSGAIESVPYDPVILNELGVAYLKLDREEDAMEYLSRSILCLHHQPIPMDFDGQNVLEPSMVLFPPNNTMNTDIENSMMSDRVLLKSTQNQKIHSRSISGAEVYSNYGTVLRRLGYYEPAVAWYKLSLTENPHDYDTHATLAYTYHLLQRYEDAIGSYHNALSLNSSSAFCSEMLNRALNDSCMFKDIHSTTTISTHDHE